MLLEAPPPRRRPLLPSPPLPPPSLPPSPPLPIFARLLLPGDLIRATSPGSGREATAMWSSAAIRGGTFVPPETDAPAPPAPVPGLNAVWLSCDRRGGWRWVKKPSMYRERSALSGTVDKSLLRMLRNKSRCLSFIFCGQGRARCRRRALSAIMPANVYYCYLTVTRSSPYTLHPTPHTLSPTPYPPYTVHRTPYTVHRTPYTLCPTPYTLQLTTYTLYP